MCVRVCVCVSNAAALNWGEPTVFHLLVWGKIREKTQHTHTHTHNARDVWSVRIDRLQAVARNRTGDPRGPLERLFELCVVVITLRVCVCVLQASDGWKNVRFSSHTSRGVRTVCVCIVGRAFCGLLAIGKGAQSVHRPFFLLHSHKHKHTRTRTSFCVCVCAVELPRDRDCN